MRTRGGRASFAPAKRGSIPPRRLDWAVRVVELPAWGSSAHPVRFGCGPPRGEPPAGGRYAVDGTVGQRRSQSAARATRAVGPTRVLLDGHDHLLGAGPRAVDLRYAEIEALVHRLLVAANTHSERVTAKSGTKDGPR